VRLKSLLRASLLSLAVAGAAHAQSPEADALIAEGIALREQGKDEAALEKFRKADELGSTPRSRAQIALAEQALGLWVAAEEHLLSALARPDDPWIAKNRAPLEGALETIRKHLGTLEVRGGVAGAEVLVDGKRIGPMPLSARVEAGPRTLLVRAPGYHPTSRVVHIPPGASARETIELTAAPEDHTPAAGAGVGTGPTTLIVPAESGGTQRTLGWASIGVGAAFIVTGTVGLAMRQSAVTSYNDDKTCPGLGKPDQPPGCEDKISRAETWQTVSVIGLAGGAVFVLGGVVLLATAPSAPAAQAVPRAACGPAAGGVACAATLTF
jgi:hypothetical protein